MEINPAAFLKLLTPGPNFYILPSHFPHRISSTPT
jgi:hypothetical protein